MSDPQVLQARTVLRVYSATTGAQVAIIDDWRSLQVERKLNSYDLLTLGLAGDDPKRLLFTLDTIIEVWRQLQGTPPSSTSVTGPIGYRQTILNDGAILYWRLGEIVGSPQASDESGNANTGTYTGGITLEQAGAIAAELNGTSNTAALFDGTSGYITRPNASMLNPGLNDFTLECWIKTTSAGSSRLIFDHWPNTGVAYYQLYMDSVGKLRLDLDGTSFGGGGSAINTGVWKHIVLSVSRAGNAVFYINGVADQTVNVSAKAGSNIGASALTVGAQLLPVPQLWMPGTIDEVAIYPTALSAVRALAHYNAGLNQQNSEYRTTVVTNPGVRYDPYLEATFFHRTPQEEITEADTKIFISYGRGLNDLLRRRVVGYAANTPFTFKGGAGETVIKEFVNENAGPGASDLINPRFANGVTSGLSIEANAGRGLQWAGQISWQNLLEVVQEISLLTRVDFDIVRTGALTFEFRCYYPQLGTDRSSYLTFSPTLGNMLAPSYTKSRTEEVNRIIVLGQGEDTNRRVIVRDDLVLQADSLWNIIEHTYDDSKDSTLTALQAAGDEQLLALRPQEQFSFRVLQTSATQYGRDYFLGDVVTVGFGSYSTTKKLVGVTLNISQGREEVACNFATNPNA